jgi:hypothetical protein
MNSTPAEFHRALVQAFGDAVQEDDTGLLLATDTATLHFALSQEVPRQLGLLTIALLRVEISVRAGNETSARNLQERVDRATQRGGG